MIIGPNPTSSSRDEGADWGWRQPTVYTGFHMTFLLKSAWNASKTNDVLLDGKTKRKSLEKGGEMMFL